MKIKKMLTLALAVLFIVSAAVPVSAITGTASDTTMFQGAQVYRIGRALSKKITVSMTISFLPGVQHLPQNDYSCRAGFKVVCTDNSIAYFYGTGAPGQLNSSTMVSINSSLTKAVAFRYYLMDIDVDLDTPVYIDNI